MENKDNARLALMGAICGDIIGSAYERYRTKDIDFQLFTSRSRFTDDTVCSIAVADAMMSGMQFEAKMLHWCRKYPYAGYGGKFKHWIACEHPQAYGSWGNGSAMRVSAIGAYAKSVEEVLDLAKRSADFTHNHPEGIKGAQATALAIYLALGGASKKTIKEEIESRFGYDLSRDYYDIQRTYGFDSSCQGSVPEAIIAFLTGSDYESTIRLAVALGGDADTQAAISGGIAAAFYGSIPTHILERCRGLLPEEMKGVISEFNTVITLRKSS